MYRYGFMQAQKNTDWAHFTHLMQELLLSSKILKSHKHAFCKASL